MSFISSLQGLLSTPQRVVLVIHYNPDGDALGSALGLSFFLQEKGHQVTVISPNELPLFITWLPGAKRVLCFQEEGERAKGVAAIEEASVLFCIDFSAIKRAGSIGPFIMNTRGVRVVIDHHADGEGIAEYAWVDSSVPATAILIYRLIEGLGDSDPIGGDLATCLYVGILTDTGGFQHVNLTAEAHLVAGRLMESGADLDAIRRNMYPGQSLRQARFLAHMMLRRLTVLPPYQAAYFVLSKKDYKGFRIKEGDTMGLVNNGLKLAGVSFAVLLVEREKEVRISLRSIGKIPVNELAKKYFAGGGHFNAAGGISSLSLGETEEKLRHMISTELPAFLG